MSSHVGDAGGLRGGTGGGDSGGGGRAGGSATGHETPADLLRGTQLAASESAGSSDRVSRPVISGSVSLEQRQDAISAIRRPHRDHSAIGFAQCL